MNTKIGKGTCKNCEGTGIVHEEGCSVQCPICKGTGDPVS